MKKGRKAQIEMMGLAVIVVLVAIGMLFFISFNLNKQSVKSEPKEEYTDKQMATNFLLAVLKTSTACKELTVQELLQDCALHEDIACPGNMSCKYVNNTMFNITNSSMNVWNREYVFTVKHEETTMFNMSSANCNKRMPAEATGFQFISLYPDSSQVTATLRICKQ